MKKKTIIAVSALLIFLAGGILFWRWSHTYEYLLDASEYGDDVAKNEMWIGDTKNGTVWLVEDVKERIYLMNNWKSVKVKKTGKFKGSLLEQTQEYRFNVAVDTSGYCVEYGRFLLDSPEKSSNKRIEYETISGDNNFTHIKEMIEKGAYTRISTDAAREGDAWNAAWRSRRPVE